ncbi:MAG: hypothetical protein IPM31_01340 [Anaerolineae bacterium]|nr:hypothetical protein [Anaerolineae bacterium]MBL8105456.1 hypothetical protein [Anaerolineales bacterium]MCC7187890.1 hypothetical protein [Anaerolineales bacterium]
MKSMKLKIAYFLALVLLLTSSLVVSAQSDYYFGVERETVNVYWNADGTLSLDYVWDFANQPGAHPIDFVDVGMPSDHFNMSTVQADVNGTPVTTSTSEYQGSGSGFAVVMGPQTIPAGGRGRVHVFVGEITEALYPDTEDDKYASGVFGTTWFGSQYVTGNTDVTMVFHFPPGMTNSEPRWHSAPSGFASEPQVGADESGRVTYTWRNETGTASTQYTFGASFPASYVPESAIVRTSALESFITGIVSLFIGLVSMVAGFLPCLLFPLFFIGAPVLGFIQNRRRKLQYMSPKISIEGHGIKRGLTAVEAAILMETSLDQVMTMILFGLVKKNAATVTSRTPLDLDIASPMPDGLYEYETGFLGAFKEQNKTTRQNLLQGTMVKLVKSVSEKIKGFSRQETIAYYKNITEKAWRQVEQAQTPEVQGQLYDENAEWTMLDRDYDDRARRTFTRPIIMPAWWSRYDPVYAGGGRTISTGAPVSSGGRSGSSALPGADFAASVVTGAQSFASNVIGNVTEFTSKVTNVTNPPPPPSSSRSGGGRSGGCACACAGCACACAGGGR